MSSSPIENSIGAVFIPVSEMARAIAWYNRLLGLPAQSTSHEGRIYDLPMQGDVGLILDGHQPVTNSAQPLCFFWTADLQATRQFLVDNEVTIVRDIAGIGTVLTLTFQDPDGNLLMVCQRR
jgi:predicted enzyme related to lactoylglutathione lyase